MNNPQLFVDSVEATDIKQGIMPDCWFLSALACLAERPNLVKRLFVTKEYNEEGIYRIRIQKNGEWTLVTIDDFIPCYYNGGPMFTRSNNMELWVMLLEKAYAKLHGSYNSLQFGFTWEGMIDLTGCPTQNIDFEDNKNFDISIETNKESLWKTLLDSHESGFLISGETSGVDEYTKAGGKAGGGLVPGHAYSIIRIVEVENVRLLNIYNPWGRFEWDGAFSDHDSHWTDKLKKIIHPIFDEKDGMFWMCMDDFIKHFSSVNI